MEITNSFITNPSVGRTPVSNEAAPRSKPGLTSLLEDASVHTPSAEFVQVMDKLRKLAEVRNEILQKVSERMQSGRYLTADAAEAAAEAILKAAE